MLVNTYSKRIFNLAYNFSGSLQEAEDLTQEIFMKLFHSLSKYNKNKNFDAWLITLSKNHLIDQYRKTKWEKRNRDELNENSILIDNSKSPENRIELNENKNIVWRGLNKLSSEIRISIILRDIQGKTYEEIAEILSLPLGTVKSRVNRGRLQLAQILKKERKK